MSTGYAAKVYNEAEEVVINKGKDIRVGDLTIPAHTVAAIIEKWSTK